MVERCEQIVEIAHVRIAVAGSEVGGDAHRRLHGYPIQFAQLWLGLVSLVHGCLPQQLRVVLVFLDLPFVCVVQCYVVSFSEGP